MIFSLPGQSLVFFFTFGTESLEIFIQNVERLYYKSTTYTFHRRVELSL